MDSQDEKEPPKAIPRKPLPATTPTRNRGTGRSLATLIYLLSTLLASALVASWQWVASGTPFFLISLLLGEWQGRRLAPWLPLWAIFAFTNIVFIIVAHSWLLLAVYTAACYAVILLSCLVQFEWAANVARRQARRLLVHAYFVQDTIGLFNLPALEIDTDSIGLLVIRGMTFSISTLTGVAYGVEVGIKLSDDMELAIQTEKVVVKLFRRIEIGDVYANVKGNDEMCFGDIQQWPNPRDMAKDQLIASGTPLLKAAAALSKPAGIDDSSHLDSRPLATRKVSPTDEETQAEYDQTIQHIIDTTTSNLARSELMKEIADREDNDLLNNDLNLRAAVSAHMHDHATIAHPPATSIRLTTLAHNKHPRVKRFLHRLPFLYRLLLSPLSYFHPVFIDSVTSTGSGKWFESLMKKHFFKHYSSSDAEIGRLQGRISAWLSDANFAVGLSDLYCNAYVPMDTTYDVECKFKIADLKAHRTLPNAEDLTQVIHLGGADATLTLPSFLLPHHEHLAPPKLTDYEEMQLQQEIEEASGTPRAVQLQRDLKMRQRDETAMTISVHGHLPAIFDQQLLNFAAATVKATKVIEDEKGQEALLLKRAETEKLEALKRAGADTSEAIMADAIADEALSSDRISASGRASIGSEGSDKETLDSVQSSTTAQRQQQTTFAARMNQTFKGMNTKMVDGWRKAGINTVNAMANDRWIAMLVGKVMRKLEKAQGDVGYSGVIALPLADYRAKAETGSKILP